MKKAIIALLTTILAAFGYVVVDKTTDSRLATLESQVSSQQEIIESLHNIGKYSTSTTTTKIETTFPTTRIYNTIPYEVAPTEPTRQDERPVDATEPYSTEAPIGYSTVPNVTNLPLQEAKNKLKSEGFNNIKVVYETTADATKDGKVTKVNYTQGLIRDDYISVNSLITLTVAQADGIATPVSTTAAR